MPYNVFAVYFSLGFETLSTEILLTMILCLLDICKAKIIAFPEGNSLYDNVRNNNNVASRNVHVVDDVKTFGKMSAIFRNAGTTNMTAKLGFEVPAGAVNVFDYTDVSVKLSAAFFSKWPTAAHS